MFVIRNAPEKDAGDQGIKCVYPAKPSRWQMSAFLLATPEKVSFKAPKIFSV